MVGSEGLEVVISAGLLVVLSAGFEVFVPELALEDVLFEAVPDEVFSSEEVASDEVFTADGSISPKTLPP